LSFFEGKTLEPLIEKILAIQARIRNGMKMNNKEEEVKIRRKAAKHDAKHREMMEFLSGIQFVCFEEAHEVSGNGFYDLSLALKNAHYRLALTATPFMKDDELANMRLMAATGPICIHVTEKQLIDSGILATPYFVYRPVSSVGVYRGTPFQTAYVKGIVENVGRNRMVTSEMVTAKSKGMTAMVLVTHRAHGEALMRLHGLTVAFIRGEDSQPERQKALNKLGRGEIDVLIGTSILDVGVDVPAVGMFVLAGGGKAEVSIRQRMGRGLRAKKIGANVCFVLDFMDNSNSHLLKHSRERLRLVSDTPGFAENVVEKFDYNLLTQKV
jgi:superfamily II DNA or RNA helicase